MNYGMTPTKTPMHTRELPFSVPDTLPCSVDSRVASFASLSFGRCAVVAGGRIVAKMATTSPVHSRDLRFSVPGTFHWAFGLVLLSCFFVIAFSFVLPCFWIKHPDGKRENCS